jgi:hypothetical protein
VKVREGSSDENEEILLFKDDKYSPDVVLNVETRSIFVKIQGILKRYTIKENLDYDCTSLHAYPLDKFHRFYVNTEGTKLAALDLNGAVSLYKIGENRLRSLGGYGLAESMNKSFRSRVSERKYSSKGEIKNPFKEELSEASPEGKNIVAAISASGKKNQDRSVDISTTAIFESIKNCTFLEKNVLIMVDENDNLMFYNFKTKTTSETKISFLDKLGKNYTHVDGTLVHKNSKIYYISYASPKQQDEMSKVSRT